MDYAKNNFPFTTNCIIIEMYLILNSFRRERMKKFLTVLLILAMVFAMAACGSTDNGDGGNGGDAETYAVAMITDYGDITDQSFNQTTYEACKAFCEANKIKFSYFLSLIHI